jgi:4-amino-4-deoxy-L-arabinose transferase-like glycosyltransferase
VEAPLPTRPKFSSVAAPPERPLPLWILYPLFFVGVYLSHFGLLHLPYFWDEAGYYIPAAIDFFRTGSLIPHSTLTNAHPPLPSILIAGWWRIAGTAIDGTRTFLCIVAAAALLGVFRLARTLAGPLLALVVVFLTALYPVWFAQSTLAHADLFAAVFTLWALSFYFERYSSPCPPSRLAAVAILFSLAALSKETAIITPLVLGLWEISLLVTERAAKTSVASVAWLAALFAPAIPLALWYVYHFHQTGFVFGNPEFLRYNATANFTAVRLFVSLWHRFVHLFLHMNMYVPVLATIAAVLMPRVLPGNRTLTRPVLSAIGVVVAGNAVAFSILGGALLTRYLLPLYPLVLLVCVAVWQTRGKVLVYLTALTGMAFIAGLWVNPPYSIAPEDNLTYADFVILHQQAISLIAHKYPAATTLTAWPATTEMEHPELGYTRVPLKTVALDNFSSAEIEKAAQDPGAYDTALLFSTKWIPRSGWLNLGRSTESADSKYFNFHRDVSPQYAAAVLHGQVVWQGYRNGEWAAVLRFPRSSEARLLPTPPL